MTTQTCQLQTGAHNILHQNSTRVEHAVQVMPIIIITKVEEWVDAEHSWVIREFSYL